MSDPATKPILAETSRNAYIDTLRGWSIFGVVCIHFAGSFVTTDIYAWSPSFWLGLTLNQLFSFAVPLFLFLSGLLAGYSKKQLSLRDYYISRLRRIGLPYLVASLALFFLLNHHNVWLALPNNGERFIWLAQRLLYFGIEPTLYFIPLIILLYFTKPPMKALPDWLNRVVPSISPERFALITTSLFLIIHVIIGALCYRHHESYYIWARPNPLFWMFYFFSGLHFRSLLRFVPKGTVKVAGWISLLVAIAAMSWNFHHLTDRAVVGDHFELNWLDLAYVRPEIMIYNLAMVIGLASGIFLGWAPQAGLVSNLGRFSLDINLWHILVLYYGAWRYADALVACRQLPELIIFICIMTTILIAVLSDRWLRFKQFFRHHFLAQVKMK